MIFRGGRKERVDRDINGREARQWVASRMYPDGAEDRPATQVRGLDPESNPWPLGARAML